MITAVLTFVAALSVGWWVALPCLLGVPPLVIGLRWYLARAKDGYLRESASYSAINATLTETVEGARTVEALGLGRRADRGRSTTTSAASYARRALHALPAHRVLPEHGDRLPDPDGGDAAVRRLALHARARSRWATSPRRRSTCRCSIDPVDRIVSILDELQLGAASLARLLGVAQVPDDREVTGARAATARSSTPSDVRFSYVEGRDVLHGVDLAVGVGERIAMVGPSGAGKSTLGRLLAGHPPAAHRLGHGRRRRPGRAAARRPARARRAGHPGAPRLRRHGAREPRAGRPAGRRRRRRSATRSPPSTRSTGSTRCPRASTPWSAPGAGR